jgi:hypothetical protein
VKTFVRVLASLVIGAAISVVAFIGTAWLVVATDTCDTTKYLCDVAPIAGFGLGALVAAVTFPVGSWLIFRKFTRLAARRAAAVT